MAPLLAVLLVALPPALAAFAVIRMWPHREPSAPKLAAGVITVVLSVSIFGVVALMVRVNRGLASYDLSFATWGARSATPWSTRGLKLVSLLGRYVTVVALAVPVAVTELRRKSSRAVVPVLVLVVGGQFAITNLIKYAVGRARPDLSQLTGFAGTSFPSGHAATSAATYAAFALLLGRGRSTMANALMGGAAVGVAVAVASTRVLLGVHWLTDVVAGLFIGWAWFATVSLAFPARSQMFARDDNGVSVRS